MVIGRFRDKDEEYKTLELHCADGLTYWVTDYPESRLNRTIKNLKYQPVTWEIPVEEHGKVHFVMAGIVFFRTSDDPKDSGERVFVYDEEQDEDEDEESHS